MKYYENLGGLLKEYRTYHSWSQEDFAEKLNVDLKSYQRWERNKHPVKEKTMRTISRVTNLPLTVLKSLNAQIAIYYSIKKHRLAHTKLESEISVYRELLTLTPPKDEGISLKFHPLSSADQIRWIKAFDHDIYPCEDSCRVETVLRAGEIVPELNFISADQEDFPTGYFVCLPLSAKTYVRFKNNQCREGELLPQDLFNVFNFGFGVLYCISTALSTPIQHNILAKAGQHLTKYMNNEKIMICAYAVTKEGHEICQKFKMNPVFENRKEHPSAGTERVPTLYESQLKNLLHHLNHGQSQTEG
jgi:transcriptional regulator with XRE-family HTH domain